MDTVTSSSPRQPLTVTSESWSCPTFPENRDVAGCCKDDHISCVLVQLDL